MSEKFGTDQVVKFIALIAEVGNVAEKLAQDGGGLVSKVGDLSSLFDEVIALGSVDFPALRDQLGDISDAEKAELFAAFKAKFNLSNDVLEEKIEQGLDLAVSAESLIEDIIAFGKSLKA